MNEVILILGGILIKDKNKWRTTNFDDQGDNYGALGDRLRVLAGNLQYQKNKEAVIIAAGGLGQLEGIKDAPTVASVIKSELIELGVPKEKIIIEAKSGTTYEQLQLNIKNIQAVGAEKIFIISNRYHLPRIKALIKYKPRLQEFYGQNSELVEAEKVLILHNPQKWENKLASIYESQGLKDRISLEQKGIDDIKSGKYLY